jgi:hypothetical protein
MLLQVKKRSANAKFYCEDVVLDEVVIMKTKKPLSYFKRDK